MCCGCAGFECLTEDLGEVLGLFDELIQEPALPLDKLTLYKSQVCIFCLLQTNCAASGWPSLEYGKSDARRHTRSYTWNISWGVDPAAATPQDIYFACVLAQKSTAPSFPFCPVPFMHDDLVHGESKIIAVHIRLAETAPSDMRLTLSSKHCD